MRLIPKVELSTETAWHPPFALFRMIQRHYPSLRFYFEPDIEYFDTIQEACAYLSAFTGWEIEATWKALEEAAEAWNDEHRDADWPVGVKQIELIGNDELWE